MDNHTQDLCEQVALFMSKVDQEEVDFGTTDGFMGMVQIIIDAAECFCAEHCEGDAWEEADWYVESDKYFDEVVAPQIYEDT